jgi:hypothetical protein
VAKNRLADPSDIFDLESKQKFRGSATCSVSATIGIDRSIFLNSSSTQGSRVGGKNIVSAGNDNLQKLPTGTRHATALRQSALLDLAPDTASMNFGAARSLIWLMVSFTALLDAPGGWPHFCQSSLELRDQGRQGFRLLIRGEVTAGQPLDLDGELA